MKIYKKIVIDIESSQVIEEESYDYTGPIIQCKGGSRKVTYQTTAIDKEYNRRMAEVAEAQQRMAEEYFNYWKWGASAFGLSPYTVSEANLGLMRTKAQMELIPKEKTLLSEQIGTDILSEKSRQHLIPLEEKLLSEQMKTDITSEQMRQGLLPIEKSLLSKQMGTGLQLEEAKQRLLPSQEKLLSEQLEKGIELEKYRRSLLPRLYELATTKIEPEKMAAQAQAQVEQSFAKAGKTVARTLSRYGLSPDSGAFGAGLRQIQLAKAMGIAGAREEAKRYAKELQWQRGFGLFR